MGREFVAARRLAGPYSSNGAGLLLGDHRGLGEFRELAVGGAAPLAVMGQINKQLIDHEAILCQKLLSGQVGTLALAEVIRRWMKVPRMSAAVARCSTRSRRWPSQTRRSWKR